MRRLRQVTEEEERLLAGGQVDKSLYSSGAGFLIDSEKLLAKGKLITVRPHTRFASFPMHRHNYVEIMYMCSGKTVHRMEGRPPLTLQAGELLFLNQHASHAVERAGEEDVGVNFIVLPQFFDVALNLIGTDNVLGKFLLSGLRQSGGEMSCLHFRVVRVVLHLRAVRFAIEQHAAILGDPGHARARHKAFQKRLRIRGLVHAQRGDAGFPLHRIVQFFGCRIVKCP